jgi:hypothetical protein
MGTDAPAQSDRQWHIISRWQAYDGELRGNLLRLIAIAAFYAIHLYDYLSVKGTLEGPPLEELRHFHKAVTVLAIAWTFVGLAILVCLKRRLFPNWLKYATAGADLLLLTSILSVADGPRSPLVAAYFLVIVVSGLRFSLPLVRCTTIGAMCGYIVLLGLAKWPDRFGRPAVDLRVPRREQLIVLLALALSGVILGQIVRRVRLMAEEFNARLSRDE